MSQWFLSYGGNQSGPFDLTEAQRQAQSKSQRACLARRAGGLAAPSPQIPRVGGLCTNSDGLRRAELVEPM